MKIKMRKLKIGHPWNTKNQLYSTGLYNFYLMHASVFYVNYVKIVPVECWHLNHCQPVWADSESESTTITHFESFLVGNHLPYLCNF